MTNTKWAESQAQAILNQAKTEFGQGWSLIGKKFQEDYLRAKTLSFLLAQKDEKLQPAITLAKTILGSLFESNPSTSAPTQRPPVAGCDFQIASEDLKDCIFSNLFGDEHLRLQGKSILVGVTRAGNGVLVMKGCFTRKAFKLAHEEAIASGMTIRRWFVYADLCTYSGPSIEFTKLEDVEIEKPEA